MFGSTWKSGPSEPAPSLSRGRVKRLWVAQRFSAAMTVIRKMEPALPAELSRTPYFSRPLREVGLFAP